MKRIIKIKETLSLTQQELADWLHVSRSSINLYELGLRSLSAEAVKRLGEMEVGYARSLERSSPFIKERKTHASTENTDRLIAGLQKKAQDCRKLAASKQEKMEALRKRYDCMLAALGMMETNLRAIPDGSPTREKDMLWIDIQQSTISLRAIACSREEQFMLQHSIDLLLDEATRHEAALDMLKFGTFNA